eukprot:TRINITY_DN4442_c0_g1_i1.p1 TRINITY_DN4442_c0_g1~~TRINITY_DN4442_c0_g1_i1.p1  ORF type:complete len:126 (-),score=33.71 TRINITY_DN4442_c0_g1_i1:431-808(-)
MKKLFFSQRYVDWIRDGLKTATARYRPATGAENLEGEELEDWQLEDQLRAGDLCEAISDGDNECFAVLRIDAVEDVSFDALTDTHAQVENFSGADDLRQALKFHYPSIPEDGTIRIFRFACVERR